MLAKPDETLEEALPPQMAYLFSPLDKRALGVAVGTVAALGVGLLTTAHLLIEPQPELELNLLSQYFAGYSVSPAGILVGCLWGFALGFVAGWFVAAVRNLVIAGWLFFTRSRAEIDAARDFLDHV